MDLDAILRQLGYTEAWVACGIVDGAFLRKQYAEYSSSEDKNQEHYRARAFSLFLASVEGLSDELLGSILLLTDRGPDHCDLSDHRAIELLASGRLTDEQLVDLPKRWPRVLQPPIQRRYLRETLSRRIRQTGVAANFDEIKAIADAHIQLEVLNHPDLGKSHVEWLAASGSNKAVRNRAIELLRSRRFQQDP